jgi:hypothetical protein
METETFSVKVPKKAGVNANFCQEAVAATLYHKGILTIKEARELIGKSRREFEEEVLPKFGYTPMDNPVDNVEIEPASSKWQ